MEAHRCLEKLGIPHVCATDLSTASLCLRWGGAVLERTGSHGGGVDLKVPMMSLIVEFS